MKKTLHIHTDFNCNPGYRKIEILWRFGGGDGISFTVKKEEDGKK